MVLHKHMIRLTNLIEIFKRLGITFHLIIMLILLNGVVRLPVTPGTARAPKPGEVIMSLAGSPVIVLSEIEKTKVVSEKIKVIMFIFLSYTHYFFNTYRYQYKYFLNGHNVSTLKNCI